MSLDEDEEPIQRQKRNSVNNFNAYSFMNNKSIYIKNTFNPHYPPTNNVDSKNLQDGTSFSKNGFHSTKLISDCEG